MTNHFTYKGIDLGVVLSARVGGLAYSATQGILDYYGVSGTSATARDNGGIPINNGKVNAQKYYQTMVRVKVAMVVIIYIVQPMYVCRN